MPKRPEHFTRTMRLPSTEGDKHVGDESEKQTELIDASGERETELLAGSDHDAILPEIDSDWERALVESAPDTAEVERRRKIEATLAALDDALGSEVDDAFDDVSLPEYVPETSYEEAPTEMGEASPAMVFEEDTDKHEAVEDPRTTTARGATAEKPASDGEDRIKQRYRRMQERRAQLREEEQSVAEQKKAEAAQIEHKRQEVKELAKKRAEAAAQMERDTAIRAIEAEQAALRVQQETERREQELKIRHTGSEFSRNSMAVMAGMLAAALVAGVSFVRSESNGVHEGSEMTDVDDGVSANINSMDSSRSFINLDTGNRGEVETQSRTDYEQAPIDIKREQEMRSSLESVSDVEIDRALDFLGKEPGARQIVSDDSEMAYKRKAASVMSTELQDRLSYLDQVPDSDTELNRLLANTTVPEDQAMPSMHIDQSTRIDARIDGKKEFTAEHQKVLDTITKGADQFIERKDDVDIYTADLEVAESQEGVSGMRFEGYDTREDTEVSLDPLAPNSADQVIQQTDNAQVASPDITNETISPQPVEQNVQVREGSADSFVEVLGKVRKTTVGPLEVKKNIFGTWKVKHMDTPGWVELDDTMASQLQQTFGFDLLHGLAKTAGYNMTPDQFMQMVPDSSRSKRRWNRKQKK